ncbi:MAG: hypothetical protein H7X95_11055 [Deltaproteobacteria bacterium]|nr:hypothetical protein [Deltaproteobacteria bacterium]
MKSTQAAVLGAVFVIGCAVGGASSHFVVPPARAGTNPTRWEYYCLETGEEGFLQKCNQLGAQGWEMAAGAGAGAGTGWDKTMKLTWCFKRAH